MFTIVGELFVVGRLRDDENEGLGWDFVALYTNFDLAEAACRDALDFVCAMPIDPEVPVTEMEVYFPHREEEEEAGEQP